MIWMAGMGVLVILLASGATMRMDNALYDLHQRFWDYAPDGDVVIVAIDSKSLDALGRFPWSRAVHARLIDRLHAAGVRGIGLDVVTASGEAGHPENDALLAQAIHRAGNVVMPVFAEPVDLGGPLQEILPLSILVENAAGIGHVDVSRDDDGLVRSAYLKAGLGQAYWPSLALALYQRGPAVRSHPTPGLRDPSPDDASPYVWKRDDFVMLRYAGPAGSFGRLSYADVLDGSAPTALLKGRWVLIGATAEGLGDMIQTPASTMPGVEYQANVLESLQHGLLVTPLDFAAQFALGGGMLALPLLLSALPGLRRPWRATLVSVPLLIGTSVYLLRMFHRWWPPAASLTVVLAGFAVCCLLVWHRHYRLRRQP
jgi:CHASE2 domain-containing sensor protein